MVIHLLGIFYNDSVIHVVPCKVIYTLYGGTYNFSKFTVRVFKVLFELVSFLLLCHFPPPKIYVTVEISVLERRVIIL